MMAFNLPKVKKVVTPKLLKAELVTLYRSWEERGLVENVDAFIESLIVERNALNPDRMDFYCKPDLINQFRVAAGQINFLV